MFFDNSHSPCHQKLVVFLVDRVVFFLERRRQQEQPPRRRRQQAFLQFFKKQGDDSCYASCDKVSCLPLLSHLRYKVLHDVVFSFAWWLHTLMSSFTSYDYVEDSALFWLVTSGCTGVLMVLQAPKQAKAGACGIVPYPSHKKMAEDERSRWLFAPAKGSMVCTPSTPTPTLA